MTTLNGLLKALENLKGFQESNPSSPVIVAERKKEKVQLCTAIADGLCSSAVKVAPKFSEVLSDSISTMLMLCDDSESDVRMVADECLNRIIRAVADGSILKIQVELLNEIKRNGSARSLRAALWRFALLSHLIRPTKGKVYVANLLPCLIVISSRSEDSVVDTLSQSLNLILKTLGPFMTDSNVKALLKAFFRKISSSQAVHRRAAASMILATCLNCRKPQVFLCYTLNYLLDTMVPVIDEEEHIPVIIGVFTCLRLMLPHLNDPLEVKTDAEHRLESLLQIYELSLYYANWHTDHNVINAALETLSQLLHSPPNDLALALLSSKGITQTRITLNKGTTRSSLGHMSTSVTTVSDHSELNSSLNLLDSSDVPEITPKVEKWIVDSENALPHIQRHVKTNEIVETKGNSVESYSDLTIGSVENSEGIEEGSDVGSEIDKIMKTPETSIVVTRRQPRDDEFSDEVLSSVASLQKTTTTASTAAIPRRNLDIGTFLDEDVPLKYCCRYLTSSFLLTGVPNQLMPDKAFRVSVKSLALNCLGHIFQLYPNMFFSTLAKTSKDHPQMMSDVLLYADHPDPQIRGNISMIISHFLKSMFTQYGGKFGNIEELNAEKKGFLLHDLVELLIKGLKDESATTGRQTLIALNHCLSEVLESEEKKEGLIILSVLPQLVQNPYFLVKIQLVELLSSLSYTTIKYISNGSQFQENFFEVMLQLLGDQDQRVRHAACNAIVKTVPLLYYQYPHEDAVTQRASQYTDQYLSALMSRTLKSTSSQTDHKFLVSSLIKPFDILHNPATRTYQETTDALLSQVIRVLTEKLVVNSSKHLTYGCYEALCLLSENYPTTVYSKAWDCVLPKPTKKSHKRSSSRGENNELSTGLTEIVSPIGNGLMSLSIFYLTSSPISLDLATHRNVLLLAGNLVCGMALSNFKPSEVSSKNVDGESVKPWGLIRDKQMSENLELLLIHVVKILNVFVHVIDDVPVVHPNAKSGLPSLPSAQSLSPKKKLLDHQRAKEKHEKLPGFRAKEQMGSFLNFPHYAKLYDILKSAHSTYMVTLDSQASELYLSLLNATLTVTSQILEIASVGETARLAEEVLEYLQTTVVLAPTATVRCVQQLLKCLFGTNLTAQWNELDAQRNLERQSVILDDSRGFYGHCFQKPARQMAEIIKIVGNNCRGGNEPDTGWIALQRRRSDRKFSSVFKSGSSEEKASVASFIRLFEPMVIKSLKQYSITSSVPLQCQVLMLLSQLVQLHVNYCLLDSDKIFIGFVLKQFEYIEDGQIQHTQDLLPRIFHFLVQLSYEKYHSKVIIGIPKIIQLCDGLLASGQSPLTHCIPALIPVVEDVFLSRNSSSATAEQKELETTREVLISMLLRLVEHHQVIELLTLCLTESRFSGDGNAEDKWRRWSRQITDTVIPMFVSRKIRIESKEAHVAFVRLFAAISPTVFRPVDPLLKILFTPTPAPEENLLQLQRWLGVANVVLLSLIAYAKEEIMLARLSDLSCQVADLTSFLFPELESRSVVVDPLNVLSSQTSEVPPERILARLIFKVIGLVTVKVYDILGLVDYNAGEPFSTRYPGKDEYLVHQFAFFLQLCIHMFESGSHCKVANAAMQMVQGKVDEKLLPIEELNRLMIAIACKCPTLTCQWCYLLTLLGYSDMDFWSRVLRTEGNGFHAHSGKPSWGKSSLNVNALKKGGTILFCDYVCENFNDAEPLTWLLVNHIEEAINLVTESPVRELLAVAVHRNPAASGLLVQAVATKCTDLSRPSFVKRLLQCVKEVHDSQSGAVIQTLVPILIGSKYLALSRMAAKMASRRVEILLTLSSQDAREQLSCEELVRIIDVLRSTRLARKHHGLVHLLNKLGGQHYDLSPLELDQCRTLNPSVIKSINLDRVWFLSQVKLRCSNPSASVPESAQLLNYLDHDDALSVLSSKEFNARILKECIRLGVRSSIESFRDWEFHQRAMSEGDKENQFRVTDLYRAARQSLLERLQYLTELLPKPHFVYHPRCLKTNLREYKYSLKLTELLEDPVYWDVLFAVMPSVNVYMRSLEKLAKYNLAEIESDFQENLTGFGILCLEVVHFMVQRKNPKPCELEEALTCADAILQNPTLTKILAGESRFSWVCTAANSLTAFARYILTEVNPLPVVESSGLEEARGHEDTRNYATACLQMTSLVSLLEKREDFFPGEIPRFLAKPLRNLILGVSRQPLVNSFVLTPPLVWKSGWQIQGGGKTLCHFPLLSTDANFLQEVDILEQFVHRVSLIGWTSRLQFEEIWMALLSVLNVTPDENVSPEELPVVIQATSLAVQGITRLLMQTLLLPTPGNPITSKPIHHPRDPQLSLHKISSQKLYVVQDLLLWRHEWTRRADSFRLEHLYDRGNIERVSNGSAFSYGQLSVPYLWSLCYLHEDKLSVSVLELKNRRNEALVSMSLDLDSCLRFLIDLYTTWVSPQANTSLRLLTEVVKSILAISELFVERSQFQWLLDVALDIWRCHPVENDVIHQYSSILACKAAAVLTPLNTETLEKVRRLLESSLKYSFLPARISALHGTLYLLQSAVLANCEDTMNMIHPLAIEYIQKHIDSQDSNGVLRQSEEHQGIMWALVFFILEHAEDTPPDAEAPAVLELVLSLVNSQNISTAFHQTLLQGLERLVATKSVTGKVAEQVVKVAIDRLKQQSPMLALPALQLLLTAMYTEAADTLNQPDIEKPLPDVEPEVLVKSIERTSAIFDRIKRGHPAEVELLCSVLSQVLGDFFPPFEILTKVIGEFLSSQQPHPRLLSAVVFKVCERACIGTQLSLLQDWVVFSLPSIIQSLPITMSTWCLSCFFISASTNQWLRALFPHVQSRIGKYEYEDKKILCIAASDFYHNLSNESQRKAFIDTFESAAKEQGAAFSDILASF